MPAFAIFLSTYAAFSSGCQSAPTPDSGTSTPSNSTEIFPGIRLDRTTRTIEFQGIVPINASAPDGIILETLVCTPDTREHETLVMARIQPSHLHQALLRLGLHPGSPAKYDFEGGRLIAINPIGPRLLVSFHWLDDQGQRQSVEPNAWIIDPQTNTHLPSRSNAGWLFAGSGFSREKSGTTYHADRDGTLIGLAAFGTETIAYAHAYSPESAYADQVWIADPDAVPPPGTSVTVRIRPEEPAP